MIKEHFRSIKNRDIEKWVVTAHLWKEKHVMDHKLVLLKQASYKQELTNWENIFITKKIKIKLHYKFWNPSSRLFK